MNFPYQNKRKTVILLVSFLFCLLILNPMKVEAKTEYDTFYLDTLVTKSPALKLKYEIKISKFKRPTKNKCSSIILKVKRLNPEILLDSTKIEKMPKKSLAFSFVSADIQEVENTIGKEFGLGFRKIFWKNPQDLTTKTVKHCLTYEEAGKMVNPISVYVSPLKSDIKINYSK